MAGKEKKMSTPFIIAIHFPDETRRKKWVDEINELRLCTEHNPPETKSVDVCSSALDIQLHLGHDSLLPLLLASGRGGP